MSRVIDALTKLNGIGPAVLLWTNAVIALLVGISHVGFLLVIRAGKTPPGVAEDVGFTYITIPAAVVVLVTAIVALVKSPLRWPVLKFQSAVLVLGALVAAYFGVRVAILGIPSGTNLVWNPVFFAFVVAYPVYLLQRSFARDGAPVNAVALQSPLWALGVSIAISAAVMWRVANAAT